jgi:triphosphatase
MLKIMSPSHEVELKLELPIEEISGRWGRGLRRRAGRGVKQHLVSVYFDTGKRALRAHGLTLRVRSDGRHRVQTVKADDTVSAGTFDRREWESEIKGNGPDLKAAARTPVGGVLDAEHASRVLAPVFRTLVDRTTWRFTQAGSEIEVALDEGWVVADGSTRPIAELELELKRGSPADLFALARSLDDAKDLKICVLSKSERGYALADGDEPSSHKAEPITLEPHLSVAGAFRTVAHACIRDFRLNEPLLIASRSAEPLHQARVAIRRLRSALSLFEPIVLDRQYPRFKHHLQDVSRQFGDARNLDVYIAHTKAANTDINPALPPPPASKPAAGVQSERTRAYGRVVRTLQTKRFRHLMQDLVAWIEAGPWSTLDAPDGQAVRDQPIAHFAGHVLDHSLRKLKHDGRHLDRLSPDERHQIRIEAKKLRYASEFLSSLFADRKHHERYKTFIAAIEDLQASLGDLNDIQSGRHIAAELAHAETASARGAEALHATERNSDSEDERTAALINSATNAHRRLCDAEPFWKR